LSNNYKRISEDRHIEIHLLHNHDEYFALAFAGLSLSLHNHNCAGVPFSFDRFTDHFSIGTLLFSAVESNEWALQDPQNLCRSSEEMVHLKLGEIPMQMMRERQ